MLSVLHQDPHMDVFLRVHPSLLLYLPRDEPAHVRLILDLTVLGVGFLVLLHWLVGVLSVVLLLVTAVRAFLAHLRLTHHVI